MTKSKSIFLPAPTSLPSLPVLSVSYPIQIPASLQNSVLLIGNFDGLHQGHQKIIEQAKQLAEKKKIPLVVFTFEPHPHQWLFPEKPFWKITSLQEKVNLLQAQGVDGVILAHFEEKMASLSPIEYSQKVLQQQLRVSHVFVGKDFRFGKNRQGSIETLQALQIPTQGQDLCLDEAGRPISSSRVREALLSGEIEKANEWLHYTFHITGQVKLGKKRGKQWKTPTANLLPGNNRALRQGVYAIFLRRGNTYFPGIANFGKRPTFEEGEDLILESHVFQDPGNLYEATIDIAFVRYLREERKFPSAQALYSQIQQDILHAKAVLAEVSLF